MLKIMDTLEKFFSNFKSFILANSTNPILWFGILGFFLILFGIAFKTLKK